MIKIYDAVMKTFYPDEETMCSDRCVVKLQQENGEEKIVVEYECGDEFIDYSGKGVNGHFELQSHCGRAVLHKHPDSQFLHGYWVEEGEDGMWRIELGDLRDAIDGSLK